MSPSRLTKTLANSPAADLYWDLLANIPLHLE
jgi:hypothetical protein